MQYVERKQKIEELQAEIKTATGTRQDQLIDDLANLFLNRGTQTRPLATRIFQDYFPDSIL